MPSPPKPKTYYDEKYVYFLRIINKLIKRRHLRVFHKTFSPREEHYLLFCEHEHTIEIMDEEGYTYLARLEFDESTTDDEARSFAMEVRRKFRLKYWEGISISNKIIKILLKKRENLGK